MVCLSMRQFPPCSYDLLSETLYDHDDKVVKTTLGPSSVFNNEQNSYCISS